MSNGISNDRQYRKHRLTDAALAVSVADMLGEDIEGVSACYISTYQKVVELTASNGDARTAAITMLARFRAGGAFGVDGLTKATKKFDAETGKVSFSMPGPLPGWTTTVSGGDPRCQVELVTEEVEVPEVPAKEAVPATTKMVQRYKLVDPEGCGAAGGGGE